jgi:hypothetical protein
MQHLKAAFAIISKCLINYEVFKYLSQRKRQSEEERNTNKGIGIPSTITCISTCLYN